jgi:hypothetical protein
MTIAPSVRQSPLPLLARTLAFWAAAIAILLGVGFLKGLLPAPIGPLAWGTGSSLLLLLLIRAFLRRDHRNWSDIGLGITQGSVPRLGLGLGLGLGTYGLTLLLVALIAGPIHVVAGSTPSLSALLPVLAGLVALAAMEELAFRSYTLWISVEALGNWAAQLLVATAFGLLHLAYGWAPTTVLFGVLPSALLFGIAAFVSRGLALPLGIHLGMNLGRSLMSEADGAGPWRLELAGSDTAPVATWAPLLGACAPLLVAGLLWGWYRLRPAIRPA